MIYLEIQKEGRQQVGVNLCEGPFSALKLEETKKKRPPCVKPGSTSTEPIAGVIDKNRPSALH